MSLYSLAWKLPLLFITMNKKSLVYGATGCPAGWEPGPSLMCRPCAAGFFKDVEGDQVCTRCPAGAYCQPSYVVQNQTFYDRYFLFFNIVSDEDFI